MSVTVDKPADRLTTASTTPTSVHPGAVHGSKVKVSKAEKRAFNGKDPVATKTTLTKQETGRVGEAVALAYLRSIRGATDARPMNSTKTNFPIDLIEDHAPTEIKAGLCSNARKSQQWRLTFSKETASEKEAYEKMTPQQRAQWNSEKQSRIRERKEEVIRELEEEYGTGIKPRTITLVVNPDTKTADIYEFSGFHDRLDYRGEAEKHYVMSVNYEHGD